MMTRLHCAERARLRGARFVRARSMIALALLVSGAACASSSEPEDDQGAAPIMASSSCLALMSTLDEAKLGELSAEDAVERMSRLGSGAREAAQADDQWRPLAAAFDDWVRAVEAGDRRAYDESLRQLVRECVRAQQAADEVMGQ